jgi:ribokinase
VPRVLVVGSANADFTIAAPRLPRPGETVSEGTLLLARGGKGANQAVAARRLGADVRLIGCVGDDASGREIRQALAGEGIGVDGLGTSGAAATGTALIVVDAEGRNQIAVAPGANRTLSPADVDQRAVDFAWAEVLLCSLEVPLATVRHAVEHARRHGVRTIVNPAPLPEHGLDFLRLADYVTPNEGEAASLARVPMGAAGDALAAGVRALGVAHAIVTLGEHGVVADGPAGRLHVPAFAVKAIDTTGAGDAFNAGFLHAWLDGASLGTCLATGIACGTFTVETVGGAVSPGHPARRGEIVRGLVGRSGRGDLGRGLRVL